MYRRLIRFILLAHLLVLALPPVALAQEAPELQINSERYIVIDAATGQVHAQKGARDEVAIASLTKLFTAVQALEMASPDTLITTTTDDLFGPDNTLMGFGPDETYTLRDLIHGMMLPSGNDAAHAIARALGLREGDTTPEQSVERFMGLLNQRILDMGLTNTHLITPSGWGVPGHHSTAWDVAAFMQHAMEYPLIVDAMSTISYTTSNGLLTISNTNKLLRQYDALIGGKTGYDLDAGWCLVEVAERGEQRMIAVTLDGIAPDDWYDDNRVLLEYGFDQPATDMQAWSGDTVAWQNPDTAYVSRVAQSESRVVAGEPVEAARVVPDTERVGALTERSDPDDGAIIDPLAAGSVLGAVAVLAGLLVVRGRFTWRRNRRGVDNVVDNVADNVVDIPPGGA